MEKISTTRVRNIINKKINALLINHRGEFLYKWGYVPIPDNYMGTMKYNINLKIFRHDVILDLWGQRFYEIKEC